VQTAVRLAVTLNVDARAGENARRRGGARPVFTAL
jgi:hypothetical protein